MASAIQVNNPPAASLPAGLAVVRSDGEELPSASGTDGDQPTEQEAVLRPPKKPSYKLRNYDTQKWSLDEKRQILKTFYYSRYEKWGRGNFNAIFEKQLRQSQIDRDKLDASSLNKLQSLVSVISEYLPADDIERIKQESLRQAEIDYDNMDEVEKTQISQTQWDRSEKWVLIWATEYAKARSDLKLHEKSKLWPSILFHHCKSKTGLSNQKLNHYKSNSCKKVFSEEEIDYMNREIQVRIRKKLCPFENPIPLIENAPPPDDPIYDPDDPPHPDTPDIQPAVPEQPKQKPWSKEEQWVLIWATELSKTKTLLKVREKCKFWMELFQHHCEDKKDTPRKYLLCQKKTIS